MEINNTEENANPFRDFASELQPGRCLALLPVSRILLERPFAVRNVRFYPPETIDFSGVRIANRFDVSAPPTEGWVAFSGQNLRDAITATTGANIGRFESNVVVGIATEFDWNEFFVGDHKFDCRILLTLSRRIERVMDMVRFRCCRFDSPESLPGPVGTWNGSSGFSTALIYSPVDHECYIIAGSIIDHSIISRGLGLDIDNETSSFLEVEKIPSQADGEVGAVAQHALSLFTDVLHANTPTSRFTRAMTLLEFLASPGEYMPFKEAKREIAVHITDTRDAYEKLLQSFRKLTGNKDPETGKERGIRTLIVHHGEYLEDIIKDENERKKLFRMLQRYCSNVLEDLILARSLTWAEMTEIRKDKRANLP